MRDVLSPLAWQAVSPQKGKIEYIIIHKYFFFYILASYNFILCIDCYTRISDIYLSCIDYIFIRNIYTLNAN